MKWKDNLIYEFINQIISLQWILKPETLWWLNRREKVLSLPCVKRVVFSESSLGWVSGTHMCNLCWPGAGTVPRAGGEHHSPRTITAQGYWTAKVLTNHVSFLVAPPGDIAWRRPPKQQFPVLTDTKKRTGMWIPGPMQGFCSKAPKPSP